MSMASKLRIVPALDADLSSVLEVLDEAAGWLVTKNAAGPWKPGSFSRRTFRDQIILGEVYIARLGQETVGTVTLQWKDEVFWPGAPFDAGYVHKLALRPAYFGRGLGLRMLEWAGQAAMAAGKKFLRLDCLADNRRIRDYYERVGFIHKGDVELSGWRASLYEKKLD